MSSGGYSGGFGQPQPPQYGGYGVPQQPQYGGFGGFGGGFGMPQTQYGGFQQPQYGGFQQPQYGGGFGLMPPPRPSGVSDQSTGEITFGMPARDRDIRFINQPQPPQIGGGFFSTGMGDMGQRGPGNAYARPFPQQQPTAFPIQAGPLAPQPMPSPFPIANPSTGVMPSEPLPDPNAPSEQILPAVLPEPQTGGGYPARDQFSYPQVIQPTMIYDSSMGLGNMLGSGLGGMYGGYSPMPYGGYQPMGGYRMFQF